MIGGCVLLGAVACGPPSEEEIRQEFAAYVAARNQCSVTDDCVLARADCPLGCYAAVNRVYQAEVEAKARELVAEWGKDGRGCAGSCEEAVPVCTNGRCQRVPE